MKVREGKEKVQRQAKSSKPVWPCDFSKKLDNFSERVLIVSHGQNQDFWFGGPRLGHHIDLQFKISKYICVCTRVRTLVYKKGRTFTPN